SAPRRSSSTWIWPIPPPTSITVAPSSPPSSAQSAIRLASSPPRPLPRYRRSSRRAPFSPKMSSDSPAQQEHGTTSACQPGVGRAKEEGRRRRQSRRARRLGPRDAGFEGGPEGVAHRLELDPVEHVLEEAPHDQPLRVRAREPARHQVEELLAVDLRERRPVGAAHVVREDL